MVGIHIVLLFGIVIFLLGFLSQLLILHSHPLFTIPDNWKDKISKISYKLPHISINQIKNALPLEVTKEYAIIPQSTKADHVELITPSASKPVELQTISQTSKTSIDESKKNDSTEYVSSERFRSDSMHSINVNNALTALAQPLASIESKPIASYLHSGNRIPIVLLTCNRPQLLDETIQSLQKVHGVLLSNILISQDGTMKEISDIATKYNIKLLQNTEGLRLRGGIREDGSITIAKHYKFSLTKAFDTFPNAPAIIIIEDDLLFSPDFLDYLEGISPVIDIDPTIMFVSAWNDNGFKDRVKNPWALLRTDFFPGLGWLLPRKLFEAELKHTWPNEHWDHWLRSPERHKGREIVYPEVPRTFHNGIKGTFMNLDTHNRYFKNIAYNDKSAISWLSPPSQEVIQVGTPIQTLPLYSQAIKSVYNVRIEDMISKCNHVNLAAEIMTDTPNLYCIWIDLAIEGDWGVPPPFEPIAKFFGLWHEHKRGSRQGLHEFHWHDHSYILLLNIHSSLGDSSYKHLKPSTAKIIDPNQFNVNLIHEYRRNQLKLEGTPAEKPGMTCDQVCASKNKSCRSDLLGLLNNCVSLNSAFRCQSCSPSSGPDQPAYVSPDADKVYSPGGCFYNINIEISTCSGSHPATYRLCACS